jgi:MoxR-like ATPase
MPPANSAESKSETTDDTTGEATDAESSDSAEGAADEGDGSESSTAPDEGDGESSDTDGDGDEGGDESENESDEGGESEDDTDASNDDEDDEDDDTPIEHPAMKELVKYMRAGLNVALVGPAGSGKTYMARAAAVEIGRDVVCHGALVAKYEITGHNDSTGNYHPSVAYDAAKNGKVHVFDELDASYPEAVVAYNGLTDTQPDYAFPNGMLTKHKDYIAIACMNTFGNGATSDYVGRFKQDASVMNRFVKVFIDYSVKLENRIARKLGHPEVAKRCQSVRAAIDTLGIRHIVSTRTIEYCCIALNAGLSRTAVDRDIIFAGLDKDTIKQVKAQCKAAGAS